MAVYKEGVLVVAKEDFADGAYAKGVVVVFGYFEQVDGLVVFVGVEGADSSDVVFVVCEVEDGLGGCVELVFVAPDGECVADVFGFDLLVEGFDVGFVVFFGYCGVLFVVGNGVDVAADAKGVVVDKGDAGDDGLCGEGEGGVVVVGV